MAITDDWQIEFQDLLMGAGTDYRILTIDGLASYPDVQVSDHARLLRHGLLPGNDFLGGRTFSVSLQVMGGSYNGMSTLMNDLKTAYRPGDSEQEMSIRVPGIANGEVAYLNARTRRLASTVDASWRVPNAPAITMEFHATDPRIYGPEFTHSASLPTSGGGATFNATMNWQFGTIISGSLIEAENSGTFPTPMQFRITGPVVNPVITNTTQDKYLAFTITLADGDFLDIDTDDRTVLLNTTANRYSVLDSSSTWFDLNPGIEEITFSADFSDTGTLTTTFRSAWI